MPRINWDVVGDRVYETGLDRGVLYLPDGSAVPWNGLTSVIENFDKEANAVYFDGMKIQDLVVLGDFSASLKAVTYPDEFIEIEGLAQSDRHGVFYADQRPKTFGLCYRTLIGNDLAGPEEGYKIHLIYNLTAIPAPKNYMTMSSDPSLSEFEWSITAVPEEIPGFRPTAHVVIDTRDIDPWLVEELEEMLYGSSSAIAALIPMPELANMLIEWYRIKIVDNGDGTWTVITKRDESLLFGANGFFEIFGANVLFLNETTYQISDTTELSDIPLIKIIDHGDGTWTATSDQDELFSIVDHEWQMFNANAVYVTPDEYILSDTVE